MLRSIENFICGFRNHKTKKSTVRYLIKPTDWKKSFGVANEIMATREKCLCGKIDREIETTNENLIQSVSLPVEMFDKLKNGEKVYI